MKNKIIPFIIFSIGIYSQAIMADDNKSSDTSASVFHFTGDQHQIWDKQTILSMKKILGITTAGNYSWARSFRKVAFHDGKKWTSALTLPGMSQTYPIKPGFPLTGKKPIAWMEGENENGKAVISFFNGSTWTPAIDINADHGALVASGGYAWTISSTPKQIIVKMTDWQNPTEWKDIAILKPSQENNIILDVSSVSLNDEEPTLFLSYKESDPRAYNTSSLWRIDTQGKAERLFSSSPMIGGSSIESLIRNNDIIISGNDHYRSYSRDNGHTWKKIPVHPFAISQNSYADGILCDERVSGDGDKVKDDATCVDLKGDSPNIQSFNIPAYAKPSDEGYDFLTNSNGAWITFTSINNRSYAFYYDINTHSLTDTNLSMVANSVDDRRAINNNQLFVCGLDYKNILSVFYYDGQTWSKTATTSLDSSGKQCSFSIGGGELRYTLDKNVWVFSDNKPQKSPLAHDIHATKSRPHHQLINQ